ncbi:MAG: DUF2306 domain-containing protein [Aureispira sp.]|nr:DUF2306 domain-containing protein [Aureispira sp.]
MHRFLGYIAKILVLVVILFSAYQMAIIALPYYVPPFPTDIDFLLSKQLVIDLRHWMIAFYIHIGSSVIVLAAGLTQFSKTLMFKYPKWHRNMGKLYIFMILVVSAPSGLVMAFYGNGGPPAQFAFVLQAVGWWFLTYMAYRTIRQKKLREHGEYILRSYAMTMSAITLRLGTYGVSVYKANNGIYCEPEVFSMLCYPHFYILVAWISWIGNLVIAEILIWVGLLNYYLGKPKEKNIEF